MSEKVAKKGRVNFGEKSLLNSISENQTGDEVDSAANDGLEFIRLHSIQAIVSAKSASKVFKSRAVVGQRKQKLDGGLMEVIHADYPLIRDDLLLPRGKLGTGGSVRSSSIVPDDNASVSMRYSMEPMRIFQELEVKKIIKTVLEEHLRGKEYSSEMCRFNSRICADRIKERVKKLFLPRYKFICLVHMGQVGQQTMRVASRCSWDTRVDNFAEHLYVNNTLWAVGLVYGVYYE